MVIITEEADEPEVSEEAQGKTSPERPRGAERDASAAASTSGRAAENEASARAAILCVCVRVLTTHKVATADFPPFCTGGS